MDNSSSKIKALKDLAKIMAKLELDKISGYKKAPGPEKDADESEPEDAEESADLGEEDEEDPMLKKVLDARAKKI